MLRAASSSVRSTDGERRRRDPDREHEPVRRVDQHDAEDRAR